MIVTAADYTETLRRFDGLRPSFTRRGRPAWYGPCPVCGDRCKTHLRLFIGESGKLHAKCYGGRCAGQPRPIWFRLLCDATGTVPADWFPDRQDRRPPRRRRPMAKIVAAYDYLDARGRLLYQCVKFEPGSPQKCAYRRPAHTHDDPQRVRADADGVKWVWDGAGLDLDKLELGEIVPAEPVLYRANELRAADPRQPVVVPGGEPDVDAARALGFVATCNAHGERNWPADLGGDLQGRRVVLVEDNDLTGRLHVAHVAGLLLGYSVRSLRIVRFRDFPDHFDFCDWLHRAFGAEDGCPRHSYQVPAWVKGLSAETLKRVKAECVKLFTGGPEWSVLTPAEQKARLAAVRTDRHDGPKETLESAMVRELGAKAA